MKSKTIILIAITIQLILIIGILRLTYFSDDEINARHQRWILECDDWHRHKSHFVCDTEHIGVQHIYDKGVLCSDNYTYNFEEICK